MARLWAGRRLPSNPSRTLPPENPAFHPLKPNLALLAYAFLVAAPLPAQTAAPAGAAGSVEGRVIDEMLGLYVEKARITIDETSLETFTDSDGFFRFAQVPAGTAKMRAFFTGRSPEVVDVLVAPGQVAKVEISLGRKPTEVVKLASFTVSTSKEMQGAAVAINEQRFASDLRNVVATDEFGFVPESNVGEFLKYVPGVTVENQGGNGRWISINGVPTENVPVTINGFSLASTGGDAANAVTSRAVEVDMVSINTLSRIEVSYSPTPESQGSALAGSVNMVGRSAFERSRPVFNGSAYLMMRDDSRDFHPTPGPYTSPTRKVRPGFDFSYVAPVNSRFGYTLTGGSSSQYSWETSSINTWRGAQSATNNGAFPDTTPDKPYLSAYSVSDRPKFTWRNAVGATLDYRLGAHDRISLSVQGSSFEESNTNRTLAFNVNRVLPGQFATSFVHGAAGAGSLQITAIRRQRVNHTFMPSLTWRHDGRVWTAEGGLGVSHQSQHYRDIDKGYFRTMTVQRSNVTVSFDDIFYLRPNRITVSDGATGAPLDPYDLGNYATTSGLSNQRDQSDLQRTVYANLSRDLGWRLPVVLKGGLDLRQSVRDVRGVGPNFSFIGADGRSSTTPVGSDDGAARFLNPDSLARPGPFGFPVIQWPDPHRFWSYYQSNPSQFTIDPNAAYRAEVAFSKHAEQVVSALFLRIDLLGFDRRLKVVGGMRAEQTNIDAEGPLTDPARNFQRDSSGIVILGANRRPVPIFTDALQTSNLTFLDRGTNTTKEYLRLFPSLNGSFNLRDNLVLRGATYESVGRPDFNQYAGGVSLPDTTSDPSPTNRIVVNNAGIKAWQAKSVMVRLEYYFAGVGQFSVGTFRRHIRDFFGSATFAATPDFLALYGVDPALYGRYDVVTQANLAGTVRMEGWDLNYKQALTFLPHWARGVQVFANGTLQRVLGAGAENFSGYVPRTVNWGVSLSRPRYVFRANWNYRSRQRLGEVAAGRSIEPGTFNYGSRRLNIELLGEYYFWKRWGAFASMRNLRDQPEDLKAYGPSTPEIARFRQRTNFGSLWTIGVKTTL